MPKEFPHHPRDVPFVQVGDFVSNELGMDLLGDALEPTKILGGTEFWGAGIEA